MCLYVHTFVHVHVLVALSQAGMCTVYNNLYYFTTFVWFVQFAKKKGKVKASEPMPLDPELEAKLHKLDNLTEKEINDKLQAMLVSSKKAPSCSVESNIYL